MKTQTALLIAAAAGLGLFLYSRRAGADEGGYNIELPESLDDLMRRTFVLDPFTLENPWDAVSALPSPLLQPSIPAKSFDALDYFTNPDLVDEMLRPTNALDTSSASTGANYVMKQWTTPAVGETGPGKYGPERVTFDGKKYDAQFRRAESKYGIPYGVLSRMAWQESRYNPNAISPVGAVGLMQIMPATAKGYGVIAADLKKPEIAIDLAGRILTDFYKWIKPAAARSWTAAIVAYNQGPGNVNKAIAQKGPMPSDWLTASNIGPDGRGYFQIAVDTGLAPAAIGTQLSAANVAGVFPTKRG